MSDFSSMPFGIRQLIENELDAGESVQWCAQPKPLRLAICSLPLTLFSLPFLAVPIVILVSVFKGGGMPLFMKLIACAFLSVFLLVGGCMMFSPLWVLRMARRTVYAVTDKRAIVFQGGMRMRIESLGPDKLQNMERFQRADGSGDLILQRRITSHECNENRTMRRIGFFAIDNVKEVEDMLETIAAQKA